jgi:hypothetical protein
MPFRPFCPQKNTTDMKEDFLHYVWQFQYFDKEALATTAGEPLQVLRPGYPHRSAGPDFAQAQLRLGGMAWAGSVEIHLRASDWLRHGHQHDPAYEGVVLHVVWDADLPICRRDGSEIPCLELRQRVAPALRERYWRLLAQPSPQLPCAPHRQVPDLLRAHALDRALLERFERRAEEWQALVRQHRGQWEPAAYQQLARYLAGPVNAQPMMLLAQHLPWPQLRRFHQRLERVEALVFGWAGMLQSPARDAYEQALAEEFRWLQAEAPRLPPYQWKWSGMRPANFPSQRLAQLASLAHAHPYLLAEALHPPLNAPRAQALLQVPVPAYWQAHSQFGKGKGVGAWGVQPLLVNWLAPLWYAYGRLMDEPWRQEAAVAFLQSLPAEAAKALQPYGPAGFPKQHAADTQGMFELLAQYCQPKRCLQCPVGARIMVEDTSPATVLPMG